MAPLVDLAARRNFLNNAELVRRLQAVGEHQKAAMIYRSHHGHADRMQLRGAHQQGYLNAAHAAELHENEADLAADMAEGFLGGDVGSATRYRPVARIEAVKATAQGEDVSGKLPHRYGLQVAPTFESAIQTKLQDQPVRAEGDGFLELSCLPEPHQHAAANRDGCGAAGTTATARGADEARRGRATGTIGARP